ncbi:SNF2-related protein [Paenibacillus sp. FA6]|uniref:SNF2-related protein n=1 Tax=Paenibacillus sp. FA6 TaxID=3413029 RepID=UPI003F65AF64
MNCFINYENFEKAFSNEVDLLLQYKVLFRQWDETKYDESVLGNPVMKPKRSNGEIDWEETKLTMQDLIEWNAGYFNKRKKEAELYDEKKEIGYYTDLIDADKSIIDMFFLGEQPLLDIQYYELQARPSQKIENTECPNFHLVFDEVGTGKTVSAIYCIRDVVSEKKNEAKILVICPNNKKSEWEKDIQRQLGLYAHTVDNGDKGGFYNETLKQMYFKCNEPTIFIKDQKVIELKTELNSWNSRNSWDLIIIDEGHLCFDNYNDLKAEKAILLTATPIVVNSRTNDGILDISKVRDLTAYRDKLSRIVDNKHDASLSDLFGDSDIFTQLFREDLEIIPKKRNIIFLECERWDKRYEYLNILAEVKGGMTRLIYEQDDEFLLEGIYRKFRNDIEDYGYLIEDKAPSIDNNKYSKLVEHIQNNNNKSYIIFFNTIWPANNTFEGLIGDGNLGKGNIIIAKKFGGNKCEVYPKDNAVTPDNVLDYLQGQIELGKRVLFITTGATGGTGLNLGKFHGVINYELPFTSIELEQRFGRVDRMDNSDSQDKEMVFMLNNDANPMLRYSTLKINKTCEYMPIRNTILFHSEFIKKNIESLKNELSKCKLEADSNFMKELIEMRSKVGDNDKKLIESLEGYIIQKKSIEQFDVDIAELLSEGTKAYIDFIADKAKFECAIKVYYKIRLLNLLEPQIFNWCNLLGKKSTIYIESASFIVADDEEKYDEYYEEQNIIRSESIVIKEDKKNEGKHEYSFDFEYEAALKKYGELGNLLEDLVETSDSQTATGLFYIKDNNYIKQTVEEYRNNFNELRGDE